MKMFSQKKESIEMNSFFLVRIFSVILLDQLHLFPVVVQQQLRLDELCVCVFGK